MIVNKKGVEVKLEDGIEGSAWKTASTIRTGTATKVSEAVEPGSPLSKKSGIPSTTAEPLKMTRLDTDPILPSAASQAIAALIADSKSTARRRSAALRPEEKEREKQRGSSIYDFSSSSPPRNARPSSRSSDRENEAGDVKNRGSLAGRRHSSLAALTANHSEKDGRGTSRLGGSVSGHKRNLSGTVASGRATLEDDGAVKTDLRASRRRSMML
jgi:hypothetical protein